MKNEKLTAVTNKICELLKGTELDPMVLKIGCYVGCNEFPRFKVSSYSEKYVYGITDSGEYASMISRQLGSFKIIGSPIREAEVLAALREAPLCNEYALDEDGYFLKREYEGWVCVSDDHEKWYLGKHLDHPENKPAVEFLFNVLNCE